MRTKIINNAKLVITVNSNKGNKEIETVSVYDNRKDREWTKEEIAERGIKKFQSQNYYGTGQCGSCG
jgi:hypothetical protein